MKSHIGSIAIFFVPIESKLFFSVHTAISDQLQLLRTMVFSFLFCFITRVIAFIFLLIHSLVQCPLDPCHL